MFCTSLLGVILDATKKIGLELRNVVAVNCPQLEIISRGKLAGVLPLTSYFPHSRLLGDLTAGKHHLASSSVKSVGKQNDYNA